MVVIPVQASELSAEWLMSALDEGGLAPGCEVTRVRTEPIGVGQGYASQLHRIYAQYAAADCELPPTFVAKLPPAVDVVPTRAALPRECQGSRARHPPQARMEPPSETTAILQSGGTPLFGRSGLIALVLFVVACDETDDTGGMSSPDGSVEPVPDRTPGNAPMDGGAPGNRGRDASTDADADMPDAGGLAECARVYVRMWEVEPGTPWQATRVPLDLLCPEPCPDLAEYEADLECHALDDRDDRDGGAPGDSGHPDDQDGGAFFEGTLVRTEGCGRVQFESGGWPRYANYNADSGKLVGAGRLDDAFNALPGTTCEDAIYVAGEYDVVCQDVTRARCSAR